MADSGASTGKRRSRRTTAKAMGGGERDEAAERSAGRLGEQMRQAAGSLLRDPRARVAEAVHGLAEALRQAADALGREEGSVAAAYADQAAAQIDRLSETVRRQSLRDMLASAEEFARRQPALFITGAMVLGFVVGRMLPRAAEPRQRAPRPEAYATTGGARSDHRAIFESQREAAASNGAGLKAGPF